MSGSTENALNNAFISLSEHTFIVSTTDITLTNTYTVKLKGKLPNDQIEEVTFTLILRKCQDSIISTTIIPASNNYDINSNAPLTLGDTLWT